MYNKFTDVSLKNGSRIVDEEALTQRVHVLFATTRRSRRHRPNVGSRLERFLFQPVSNLNATLIKAEIAYVLSQEPSIVMQDGSEIVPNGDKSYKISLNLFSTELGRSFEFIQELNLKV